MTRDNPYINLPPGGCALDGLERTRLLKDMEVKLRDVTPRHEVGHIALTDAQPFKIEKLAIGRLYALYIQCGSKEGVYTHCKGCRLKHTSLISISNRQLLSQETHFSNHH